MTLRRPLVNISGNVRNSPHGDELDVQLGELVDVSTAGIGNLDLLAYDSGSPGWFPKSLSALMDLVFGATRGSVLYRGASAWVALGPGAVGQALVSGGAGADPAWGSVGGGAGGAVTLISEVVTAGSQTNVSFASLGAFRDLQLRVRGRGTKSAVSCNLNMRFNGDTGNNYDWINNTGNLTAQTAIIFGFLAAANAPANAGDFCRTDIGNYRDTTFQKAVSGQCTVKQSTSAIVQISMAGWWRSTAAITQIDVFPDTSAFADGSVFSLYGWQ